jgi:arginyl-tRNA synthetase
MDSKPIIAELLFSVFSEADAISVAEIARLLELPKDAGHGDIAFPCFALAKSRRQAPPKIASELAAVLSSKIKDFPELEKVVATGPYLNFFLNKGKLAGAVVSAIITGEFLARRPDTGQRAMVEYSQPNTHKAFHVGHTRNASLGDSLVRLLEWTGNTVIAANYIGDEGAHVAKCLWFLRNHYKGEIPAEKRGEFLGMLYARATEMLDLASLTDCPYQGVIAVKVLSRKEIEPEAGKKFYVAEVDTGNGVKQVLTGAPRFEVGTKVAYALPGTKVEGRTVGSVNRYGYDSEGMLCAPDEIGLTGVPEMIQPVPESTALGTELAEVFAKQAGSNVIAEWKRRNREVSDVLAKLENNDPEMKALWSETRNWCIEEFKEIYRWLNSRFDYYFFESELAEAGKEIVREFQTKGIFTTSDGAIGADLSAFGLGFCLLIKRDGNALYATRDLALARRKFEQYKIDRSIYVVDEAQRFHFQQVFKCLELMGFEQAKQCFHLPYAQVVRPDGKMSSRKGNIILFHDLRSRLITKVNEEYLNRYRGEWGEEEIRETGERIALATIRYGMLNQDNDTQIIFDIDQWVGRTGNTGPYLLYAVARINSILEEAKDVAADGTHLELLAHQAEIDVILHLKNYHDIVTRAAEKFAPHHICSYLFELTKLFNSMYAVCSVLRAETPELRAARVTLIRAVKMVTEHGLGLLGIRPVQRM